jgi:DNA-binding response OmpR family regulator
MMRPTILVAEPEPEQALSVRKLVLESAKFNVLTAHSRREAEEISRAFPGIAAAIVTHDPNIDCEPLIRMLRQKIKKLPIVVVTPHLSQWCEGADHHVSSHEPEQLLELMRSLLGDPRHMPAHKHQGAAPQKGNGRKKKRAG